MENPATWSDRVKQIVKVFDDFDRNMKEKDPVIGHSLYVLIDRVFEAELAEIRSELKQHLNMADEETIIGGIRNLAQINVSYKEAAEHLDVTTDWENKIWTIVNRRRGELINRKFTDGLGPEDTEELDLLQAYADYYLERFDLPKIEFLKAMKAYLEGNQQ